MSDRQTGSRRDLCCRASATDGMNGKAGIGNVNGVTRKFPHICEASRAAYYSANLQYNYIPALQSCGSVRQPAFPDKTG